jgi:hypothetical protein
VQQIFEYNTEYGNVRLFDLPKLAAHNVPAKCVAHSEVLGTTESGAIVIQLRSGKYCAHTSRWLLNSQKGPLRRVSKRTAVHALYSNPGKPTT